jgi:hypothetical protein
MRPPYREITNHITPRIKTSLHTQRHERWNDTNDNTKIILTIYFKTSLRLLAHYRSYRSIVHIIEVFHEMSPVSDLVIVANKHFKNHTWLFRR